MIGQAPAGSEQSGVDRARADRQGQSVAAAEARVMAGGAGNIAVGAE